MHLGFVTNDKGNDFKKKNSVVKKSSCLVLSKLCQLFSENASTSWIQKIVQASTAQVTLLLLQGGALNDLGHRFIYSRRRILLHVAVVSPCLIVSHNSTSTNPFSSNVLLVTNITSSPSFPCIICVLSRAYPPQLS